jgi:hypothetical protein
MVQFLNAVVPDKQNGDCVTWAIRRLGEQEYEAAVPTLVRLLDFQRPPNPREKAGFIVHPVGLWDLYPAAGSLSLIGEKALPEILRVIEAASVSQTARENALFVWMETYRRTDSQRKGVAVLKQEEIKANDEKVKQRLKWAVQKALTWCSPQAEAACRQAAESETP